MSDTIVCIFARGGSKGLPRKNIMKLDGVPLIGWSIACAKRVSRVERIFVSTDDPEIAAVATEFGAEVPFLRPKKLSRDDSSEWLAWRHFLEYFRQNNGCLPNALVSLPATAPLRSVDDVDRCLDLYFATNCDIVLTYTEAHRNPYFNMVTRSSDCSIKLVCPGMEKISNRQDAPLVFDMTTVAKVARPEFVLEHQNQFSGDARGVFIPSERAIDIDNEMDFIMCEHLINRAKDRLVE